MKWKDEKKRIKPLIELQRCKKREDNRYNEKGNCLANKIRCRE